MDGFDLTFQPDLDVVCVKELATLRFVEQKAKAIFLGPPGTGTTHGAVALTIAACQHGFSIDFTTLDDLVQHLTTAEQRHQLQHTLHTSMKPAFLVVDEGGLSPPRSSGSQRPLAADLLPLRAWERDPDQP